MVAGIPFVHGRQTFIALMHRQHRSFRQHIQIGVGDDGGDLNDAILLGAQTGHFQVDPDQVVFRWHLRGPVR